MSRLVVPVTSRLYRAMYNVKSVLHERGAKVAWSLHTRRYYPIALPRASTVGACIHAEKKMTTLMHCPLLYCHLQPVHYIC